MPLSLLPRRTTHISSMTWENLDPYATLEVEHLALPIEIKRAYKRLSLRWHPDKNKDAPKDAFAKVQFAYKVLSDSKRRRLYDELGRLDEGADDDFDWLSFFQGVATKISVESIEEDRRLYVGSEEEARDIVDNFVYYEGDFLRLFEVIPHLEFTEELEERVFNIVEAEIAKLGLSKEILNQWEKYRKSRKTKVKRMLKKLAKEAKEAETLKKQIEGKADLKLLIQLRNKARAEDFIAHMEAKYGGGRGKKRTEPSDDEFERTQRRLKVKKETA